MPIPPTTSETAATPPSSNVIVELTLEIFRERTIPVRRPRIADIGTGSGAILLGLLHEIPGAFGVGTDVSLTALKTARENAAALGLADRSSFVACSYLAAVSGPFDIIVSISTRREIEVWWLQLVGGIIEIVLGFWAAGYYGRSTVLLIAWVAKKFNELTDRAKGRWPPPAIH